MSLRSFRLTNLRRNLQQPQASSSPPPPPPTSQPEPVVPPPPLRPAAESVVDRMVRSITVGMSPDEEFSDMLYRPHVADNLKAAVTAVVPRIYSTISRSGRSGMQLVVKRVADDETLAIDKDFASAIHPLQLGSLLDVKKRLHDLVEKMGLYTLAKLDYKDQILAGVTAPETLSASDLDSEIKANSATDYLVEAMNSLAMYASLFSVDEATVQQAFQKWEMFRLVEGSPKPDFASKELGRMAANSAPLYTARLLARRSGLVEAQLLDRASLVRARETGVEEKIPTRAPPSTAVIRATTPKQPWRNKGIQPVAIMV